MTPPQKKNTGSTVPKLNRKIVQRQKNIMKKSRHVVYVISTHMLKQKSNIKLKQTDQSYVKIQLTNQTRSAENRQLS